MFPHSDSKSRKQSITSGYNPPSIDKENFWNWVFWSRSPFRGLFCPPPPLYIDFLFFVQTYFLFLWVGRVVLFFFMSHWYPSLIPWLWSNTIFFVCHSDSFLLLKCICIKKKFNFVKRKKKNCTDSNIELVRKSIVNM